VPELRAGPPGCSTPPRLHRSPGSNLDPTAGRSPQPKAAPKAGLCPAAQRFLNLHPSKGPGRARSCGLAKAASPALLTGSSGCSWGHRAPRLVTHAPSTGLSRWQVASRTGSRQAETQALTTGSRPRPHYGQAAWLRP